MLHELMIANQRVESLTVSTEERREHGTGRQEAIEGSATQVMNCEVVLLDAFFGHGGLLPADAEHAPNGGSQKEAKVEGNGNVEPDEIR